MDNFLSIVGERKFLLFSSISCFIGDFLIGAYVYYVSLNLEQFNKLFQKVLTFKGISSKQIDSEFIQGQFYIIKNSILLLIALVLFVHLIVYLLYFLKRRGAIRYVQISLWLTIPTSVFFIYEAFFTSKVFALLFLIQTSLYYLSFKGNRFFKLGQNLKTEV